MSAPDYPPAPPAHVRWNEGGPSLYEDGFAVHNDGGRGRTVPIGADQLPPADPRLANGFGGAPVRETIPVERHPSGEPEGRGGQFK